MLTLPPRLSTPPSLMGMGASSAISSELASAMTWFITWRVTAAAASVTEQRPASSQTVNVKSSVNSLGAEGSVARAAGGEGVRGVVGPRWRGSEVYERRHWLRSRTSPILSGEPDGAPAAVRRRKPLRGNLRMVAV